MRFHNALASATLALVFTPVVILSIVVVNAQVMQSTSYRIESDSINFGGGFSSSTNYVLESTAGEIATGESNSTSYGMRAGYQQMVTSFLSMTTPNDITMNPPIPGIGGGTTNGSTTVTVTTDNGAGYQMTIEASQSPAMQKGSDTIADYVPAGSDPDYSFITGSADAHLGYSPSGVDIAQRFMDDGPSVCNAGNSDTALTCWDGLSTTPETIVSRTSANTPNGSTTTVNFRVEIGASAVVTNGVYVATTTLTAFTL